MYSLKILLFIFLNIIIIKSCPFYPKPIKINQNDPLLVSAYQQIESLIDYNLKLNNISSFIFTIVYMDEIVWSKTYGNINPVDSTSPPLTLDSNFRIASCTKTFTSLMMFQLRDKGLLRSLDDEIKEYYSKFKINDINNQKRGVTFRELASHTSGLPRETPCDPKYYGTVNCTEEIILDRLSKQFLLFTPYKQAHYSNIGYSVLGRALGEIYKHSNSSNKLKPTIQHPQIYYEDYIEESIFKQLEMNNSSFDLNQINTTNLAKTYFINSNGSKKLIQNNLSGWNSPGGGIYSTARDMSKFIKFLLNGDEKILQESSRYEYLTSVTLFADGNHGYGLPFEMFYDNNTNIWFKKKNGLLYGYRSQITLAIPFKLGAFGISMNNAGGDLFTTMVLSTLIPIYQSLLVQQQQQEEMKQYQHKNQFINEYDLINFKLIIGHYNNSFGDEGFNIDYNSTLNSLIGYFDDTPTTYYSISNFTNDSKHSNIKRLHLLDFNNTTCSSTVNGPNEELIYFNYIKKNDGTIIQCDGLYLLGYSLNKVN